MKELMVFKNLDDYAEWIETVQEPSEKPVMIDDGWQISIDLMTRCKKWKTAVRRLARAVSDSKLLYDWLMETVMESCGNGCFKDIDGWQVYGADNKALRKLYGCYGWGVEQVDEDRWYIYLNLSGVWADYNPKAYSGKEV